MVHAPGSYLTYEPQWNSDVNSVHENVTAGEVYTCDFLVENCPEDRKRDIDYVMSLMDWEENVDPHYRKHYFRPSGDGYAEKWIVYANDYIAAQELTVEPGRTVAVKEQAAHGCLIIQGHGKFGVYEAEAAGMLRFGQTSADEYFVSETAAGEGVVIENRSKWEPMVILKHFGPNHLETPSVPLPLENVGGGRGIQIEAKPAHFYIFVSLRLCAS